MKVITEPSGIHQIKQLEELWHADHSISEIAQLTGLSSSFVYKRLKMAGVDTSEKHYRPPLKKVNDEMIGKIKKSYLLGDGAGKIAKLVGLHKKTVFYHLRRVGIDTARRKVPVKIKQGDVEEIARLYKNGWNLSKLAEKYRVDRATIRAHLIKLGIYKSPRPQIEMDKCIGLYRQGWSTRELASYFGVDRSTIAYRLKKTGIVLDHASLPPGRDIKALKKYDLALKILTELFGTLGYKVIKTNDIFWFHGPDLVLEKGGIRMEVEFKAEKWSGTNWKRAIKKLRGKKEAILVTFADKPANFKRELLRNTQII